jgi:hypothetical protein
VAVRRPDCFWPLGAPSQQTSANTGDVKTFTAPKGAAAFLISVSGNACRFTVDGSAPSPTVGIAVQTTAQAVVVPVGPAGDLRVVSAGAVNSVVDVQFLG